jgi:hypothetical protein
MLRIVRLCVRSSDWVVIGVIVVRDVTWIDIIFVL